MSHRLHGSHRRRLPLCAAISLVTLTKAGMVPARAQSQTVNIVRGNGQQTVGRQAPQGTLTQSLQTLPLRGEIGEKSVLLWVGIAPDAEPRRLQRSDFGIIAAPKPLQPDASGMLRLPDIAAYFDRRVVRAGSITVLAPTKTSVLATNLPIPDIYAGLTTVEKLRRLQITLSPAQWQLIGSPTGLGIGDLKGTQRAIFASLLPDPVVLKRTVVVEGFRSETGNPNPLPLSPAQRTNVRLTLYRTMSWMYTTNAAQNGGVTVSIGNGVATGPEKTETLSLYQPSHSSFDTESTLFGVAVKTVVPDRAKPSDIAYDSSALDKIITLGGAKTVGEVINAVKAKTGAALFCDIRYRDLPVYTKGGDLPVRAGDALQALALAVSGTYRKVGGETRTAYVLTDDLEGLGTRQARIAAWAQTAFAKKSADDAIIEAAMRKITTQSIGDYVGWRPGDTSAASGPLAQQIDDYRTGKIAPASIDNKTSDDKTGEKLPERARGLWVSVSDLPPNAQKSVAESIASWNSRLAENQNRSAEPSIFKSPLREDKVLLEVQTGIGFLIPGVGFVEAENGRSRGGTQNLLASPSTAPVFAPASRTADSAKPASPTEGFHLSKIAGSVHALLIRLPQNAAAAQKAVGEARAHGFNQLWLEMPSGDETANSRLQETIAAAETGGLRVQAVVRFLRKPAGSAEMPRDLNIIGETTTQWAERVAQIGANGAAADYQDYAARQREVIRQNAQIQQKRGDFLDAAAPSVEAAVLSQLKTLAQTPQLAGIVVRDVAAPGSEEDRAEVWRGDDTQGVANDFGYTPARRLAFLQQTGVDPVDLSPLTFGNLNLGGFSSSVSLNLPQFPDYGANGRGYSINGITGDKLGAKNTAALWNTFRQDAAASFWNRLRKAYTASSADVPLLRQNTENAVNSGDGRAALLWAGTWDKSAPNPPDAPPKPDGSAQASKPSYAETILEKAQQKSSRAALIFRYNPTIKSINDYNDTGDGGPDATRLQFNRLLKQYLSGFQDGWDGIVIDLSALPLDDALPLLQNISASAPETGKPKADKP